MAASPVHKLGQMIGDFIEKYFEGELTSICHERQLYLDVVGKNRAARKGKKVSLNDVYGNKHDLDFLIERGGSESSFGTPAALIECAWRRYTKHSKNKAQEIQGAILPIAEKYKHQKPFLGAILAGVYTDPSVQQLKSCGFEIVYFKYEDIISAFSEVGIDIQYDEQTTDAVAEEIVAKLESLTNKQYQLVFNKVALLSRAEINEFKQRLISSLDRQIIKIILSPLYGTDMSFATLDEAVDYLDTSEFKCQPQNATLKKIFAQVRYSNGDVVSGDFLSTDSVTNFLKKIAS